MASRSFDNLLPGTYQLIACMETSAPYAPVEKIPFSIRRRFRTRQLMEFLSALDRVPTAILLSIFKRTSRSSVYCEQTASRLPRMPRSLGAVSIPSTGTAAWI